MARMSSRASDERLLDWIARRCAGESINKIAEMDGVSRQMVSKATLDVRENDVAESGKHVREAYWS